MAPTWDKADMDVAAVVRYFSLDGICYSALCLSSVVYAWYLLVFALSPCNMFVYAYMTDGPGNETSTCPCKQ
jgi:hypothetical protein